MLNRHKIHTAVLLPERLRAEFGFPEVTPKLHVRFGFDVRLASTVLKYAPSDIKYIPPYNEAMRRLKGQKAGLATQGINRLLYGQALLVS